MLFCAKTPINKLYVFTMALLLAVTLAGCGSSNGGSADTSEPPVTMPDPALQAAADAASAAADAAEAAADAAENAAADTSTHAAAAMDKAAADAAAMAARAAATEARAAAVAAQAAAEDGDLAAAQAAQGNAEAARTTAETERGNAETAMADAATAEAEAIAAEMEAEAARIAAATEAAKTKSQAIINEAAGSTTAPFDSLTAGENYTVTAEIEDGVVVAKIAIPGAAMDDPEFMRTGALPAIGDWDGSMYTLGPNDDGETEVIGVYTDIAVPTVTDFGDVYTLNVDLDAAVDADDDGTANNDYTALAIDQTDAGVRSRVESDAFTAVTSATLTFANDDTSTGDMNEGFEAAGTYAGHMGRYRCFGSSQCEVVLDADGEITSMTSGWIFIPDAGVTIDVQDSVYFYYGFWVKSTEEEGATTYDAVQTFAGGSGIDLFPGTEMANVLGTASYEGGAAGVFTKGVFTPEGTIDTSTSGTFTADVSLTAYFGGGDVAVNKQYSVEGSVSNFALSGGEENAWSVNLKADFTSSDNFFRGTANGGGAEKSWHGAFYGAAADTPATDDGSAKQHPEGVLGEFNANFSNGRVAGAFGAHKQ
ncbi:MAG: hypothetical protein OXL41_12180 [Nitrospinae bacterium]|nr:hypothetical protein [Nitrospinota bacterium]